MGMLDDALFDPATYTTPGMLAQMFAAGTPSAPPPGWAPGLAPPMDVPRPPGGTAPSGPMSSGDGGAMMPVPMPPQAPDQAALPPNAAPTAGQDSPPNVPPTSLMGRIGDALKKAQGWTQDNRSTLMALGAGMAGAQSWGQGLNRGMTMAIPAQQADVAQQKQNQTVDALMKRGIPKDVALAAANNPAIMQQLIGQVFGPKALQHVTIKDRLGNEIPMAFNPSTGKYTKADTGGEFGGASGDPNLTGEAYLKTLDPLTRNEVKAFAEGRAPITARNLQQMLPLVTQYDPGFDASQYPVRLATRKSYTSGKDFQETQALNTVSGHMGRLVESANALPNGDWPIINKARNWFADTFTGSPALVKFRNDLVTTQNELAKAYHGGHVSDSAYNAFSKAVNEAQTPAELKAAIGELGSLLQSKIEAKESGYRSSMGTAPLPSEFKAINDHAREAFGKINDWAIGVPKTEGNAPEPPKVGTVKDGYRFKGGNPGDPHSWEPVKS